MLKLVVEWLYEFNLSMQWRSRMRLMWMRG